MKRYGTYIKPYLGAFILGPLLMLTEVAGEIMLPKLMSMIINNGVAQRNVQYILSVGGLMILATLIMAIGGIGGAYFSVKAAVSFTSDLRDDLFSKVQEFSFKNIDSYSTGSLVTRLTNDIQQVQNVLMMGLRMAMRAPGMFIGALIMAFMMNARLAVVILVVIGGNPPADSRHSRHTKDSIPQIYRHAEKAGPAKLRHPGGADQCAGYQILCAGRV